MSQMSVTRAMVELGTLDDRINKIISNTKFISMVKGNQKNIGGIPREDVESNIVKSYKQVTDLIVRRHQVKRAIVLSNAGITAEIADKLLKHNIGGQTMTVAEAIEYKSSIQYEVNLLKQLQAQLSATSRAVESENMRAENNMQMLLQQLAGADKKFTAEEQEEHAKKYMEAHFFSMVDPLKIMDCIADLEEKINSFRDEVDVFLGEKNATTVIEIPDELPA